MVLTPQSHGPQFSTRHCAGRWWFHTGVGGVLKAWVGSTNPLSTPVTGAHYVSLLGDRSQPFMDVLPAHSNGMFQQDNAPWHWAQAVQNWFELV